MTSSIKPPSSSPAPSASVDEAARTTETSTQFRAELEKARGVSAASATSGPTRATELQSLAAELRAGRIDVQGAIDRLVEAQLSRGAAARMPEKARAQLGAVLRARLAEDPTLLALRADLEPTR